MSKINYDEVPGCYLHCIKADCKMANHCLRQLAMQNLPSNLTAVTILNPQLTQTGEGCEYYRDDKPQVYGKGFKNMQKKMLPDEYQTFMYRLQGKFVVILTSNVARVPNSVHPAISSKLKMPLKPSATKS